MLALLVATLASAPAAPTARDLGPSARPAVERVDGLLVEGDAEFRARTKEALALLARSGAIVGVTARLQRIVQAPCSGVFVDRGVYAVGPRTSGAGALWYAGTIAHDSYHAELWRRRSTGRGPATPPWDSAGDEVICLRYQIAVLRRLGADADTLAYLAALAGGPTYQDKGRGKAQIGGGGPDDVCRDRNW